MSSLSIQERLLNTEKELFDLISGEDPHVATAFEQKWAELCADIEGATQDGTLDEETKALAYNIESKVTISVELILRIKTKAANMTTDLVTQLEGVFDALGLDSPAEDDSDASSDSIPVPSSSSVRLDRSLPPYIEPAYKWLLRHLHNPYPKKEIKEKIADETGSSIERVSDWFVDVRRRMGWTTLLREEYGRKRVDLVDAATRYYLRPNRKYPLPAYIHGKFVEMEAFAKDMYAAKLVPSALSNKLTAAVKALTPELQEKARQQRLKKVQGQRDANLGIYPSPPTSGASSPISDPDAYAGRKRSYSEASDDDNSTSKRSRTDAFALPSPPSSSHSSPNSRKRRLSDADAPGAKRPRTNRATSDPTSTTFTLSGTPETLADWFSSDPVGDTNLFDPGQLLDIKFFDPSEFNFLAEEAPASEQPVIQATLPATSDTETVSFDVPADIEHLFNFEKFPDCFAQSPPAHLDQPIVSYDLFPGPVVYEPPSFMEPFTGSYDSGYLTQQSVIESLGFEPVVSYDAPHIYSAFPDGKASGLLIDGLLEQQHKIQNESALYQPII